MLRRLTFTVSILMFFCIQAFSDSESDSGMTELRKPRAWAVSAEIGMNSLSSLIGPVVTYYAKPQVAVDLGIGLSSSGLRPGVRARYLFSTEKTSYFGGLGLKYGLGSNGQEIKVQDPESKLDVQITTEKTAFLDLQFGADFLADNGFLVIGTVGYSALLTDKPYQLVSGTLTDKGVKTFDTVFGSGILLGVSLGKAF